MSCNFSFLPLLKSMKRRALALVVLVLAGMSPQVLAATGSIANADPYDVTAAYPTPGTRVSYTEEDDDGVLRGAIFTNSWYINPGIAPTFYPGSTGWVKEGPTLLLANAGDTTGDIESNPQWHPEAAYIGGNVVVL
jgi:hypothetical protein